VATWSARMGRRLAGLWLIVATAVVVAGCGAPEFTYISDVSAQTAFRVPYSWHKLSDSALASVITGGHSSGTPSGIWAVGYDAASTPSASHVLGPGDRQPFAFAMVLTPTASMRNAMSYDSLRDFFFPVTPAARQNAMLQGFKLTHFRLLHDAVLTPGHGIHGVRETFSYRYPDGSVDTFDQVALTNADDSQVYLLLVHCLATCYQRHQGEINTVMTSFTVRS
jgi:hypothetical protein